MEITKTILITGATSGIGAELARQYAAPGILLALTGRNEKRLAQIALECERRGAKTICKVLDVTEILTLEDWINELPKLDLVIANAGISGEPDREIFATNIGGVINTVLPAIEKMKNNEMNGRGGQIAIMASLAGIRGLPSAPAYSASKACVLAYGQALRGSLREYGISVSTICPGWVKTPLADKNTFPMPLIMNAEKAAKIIIRGLARKKSIITFPLVLYAALKILDFMPTIITDKIFGAMPKK